MWFISYEVIKGHLKSLPVVFSGHIEVIFKKMSLTPKFEFIMRFYCRIRNLQLLTVALFLGTLVPERSIPSISSRLIMVFKNCPQGLPLKFQGASFGAIKFFWGEIFIGSLTGNGPEITIIIYSSRVFRPNVTYMACCWGSVLTEISVTWVMALKCQKKVRASSRKKAQLLRSVFWRKDP